MGRPCDAIGTGDFDIRSKHSEPLLSRNDVALPLGIAIPIDVFGQMQRYSVTRQDFPNAPNLPHERMRGIKDVVGPQSRRRNRNLPRNSTILNSYRARSHRITTPIYELRNDSFVCGDAPYRTSRNDFAAKNPRRCKSFLYIDQSNSHTCRPVNRSRMRNAMCAFRGSLHFVRIADDLIHPKRKNEFAAMFTCAC